MIPFLNLTSTRCEAPSQTPATTQRRSHSPRPWCYEPHPVHRQYVHQSYTTQETDNLYTTHHHDLSGIGAGGVPIIPTFNNTYTAALTEFPDVDLNHFPLYRQSNSCEQVECPPALVPFYFTSACTSHTQLASMPAIVRDSVWDYPGPNGAFYNAEITSVPHAAMSGSSSAAFTAHGEHAVQLPIAPRTNITPHNDPAPAPIVYADSQPPYDEWIETGGGHPTDGWQFTHSPTLDQSPDARHEYIPSPPAIATTVTNHQMTLPSPDFEEMLPQGHGIDGAPPKDESLICGICSVGPFARSHERQRHENTVHGPPRWHCSVCGKPYRRKDTMERHRREKHKNL